MKKILVTLGPSSLNEKTVKKISELGVDLFRINLSHTSLSDVEKNIKLIKSWTKIPICLDSEGAQLRNGLMKTEKVYLIKMIKSKFFEPIRVIGIKYHLILFQLQNNFVLATKYRWILTMLVPNN